MKELINEKSFTEKDWISAVSLIGELNRNAEAASLSQNALQLFPGSSYLHYLLGRSWLDDHPNKARKELQKAVRHDPSNEEAAIMLKQRFK